MLTSSTRYSSCNQEVKDVINNFLGKCVLESQNFSGSVVTLDDEDNGTCCALKLLGFEGPLTVVQRDYKKIRQQVNHFESGKTQRAVGNQLG